MEHLDQGEVTGAATQMWGWPWRCLSSFTLGGSQPGLSGARAPQAPLGLRRDQPFLAPCLLSGFLLF